MKTLATRSALLAFALLSLGAACVATRTPVVRPETPADHPALKERQETAAEHDARLAWWRDARFGMFIHWGLYAQSGGRWNGKHMGVTSEWMMWSARIPIADYTATAKDFNPKNFDAEKWVLTAKNAGMKYIVITAKHHEGFAMFKTAASPFNIVDATPFARDPLKDLAAACRKHGIKLGFYYSQNLDWHHPGGGIGLKDHWDPAHRGDSDKYVDDIVIPQLREILSNYGDIAILWFDIPGAILPGGAIDKARADRIQKAVLECQPKIITNNRLGGGYKGDIETPEQFTPANGFPGKDWETCMTMNNSWGYRKDDNLWKSGKELVRILCDGASKGGNYLLNVGPNELGEIPAASLERLAQVGEWTKKNGEAIYGTRATPFTTAFPWGRVTRSGHNLYLLVFDLPKDRKFCLRGLATPIKGAHFLVDFGKAALPVSMVDGDAVITVPEGATLDPVVSVIKVELSGPPRIEVLTRPAPDGSFLLQAQDAVLDRPVLGSEGLPEAVSVKVEGDHISNWTHVEESASWTCFDLKAGKYRLSLAAASPAGGSLVAVLVNGKETARFTVPTTGNQQTYAQTDAGEMTLPNGRAMVTLRPVSLKGSSVMNLRTVKMTPVK